MTKLCIKELNAPGQPRNSKATSGKGPERTDYDTVLEKHSHKTESNVPTPLGSSKATRGKDPEARNSSSHSCDQNKQSLHCVKTERGEEITGNSCEHANL